MTQVLTTIKFESRCVTSSFKPLGRHTTNFGVVMLAAMLVASIGCGSRHSEKLLTTEIHPPSDTDSIVLFCADCHELAKPSSFAKDRWVEEVEQGFRIYKESARTDLIAPDVDATIAFFRDQAPEELVILPPQRIEDEQFIATTVDWTAERKLASISSVLCTSNEGEFPEFLLTDMRNGAVTRVDQSNGDLQINELANVAHPAHVEPVDLDQDGVLDYLVADLGTLNPQVEKQGSVWWLQGRNGEPFERRALKLGLARVADARPIDYDDDGDLDLLVGDFGLHFVGSIYLGTNEEIRDGVPRFTWRVIDSRPGTISLPTVDFDGDGRLDFFALIAQHYETVELNLNRGNGVFETKVIFAAGDPSAGTSGMELVDFDNDGDIDVLYTNGDTFDDTLAKPYHGIKWLENEGVFPFTVHQVAEMPGCYRAVSGDIDGDGDMDVAAVAYLSDEEVAKYPVDTFDGVVWFEQEASGSFRRHSMRKNVCQAATCDLLDWDLDGDLDLLVPPSITNHTTSETLTVFVNQLVSSTPGSRR